MATFYQRRRFRGSPRNTSSVVVGGITATMAFTLDDVTVDSSATLGQSATLAVQLGDIQVSSTVVLGHTAIIGFTLDDISVAMTATNTASPPVITVIDYFIEIRSFTERRRI